MHCKKLLTRREKLAQRMGAVATDRKGIEHSIGVFEYEGMYDKFITQGAKRYCYIQDGEMHITVSGVSKAKNEETDKPIAVEELGCIENFKEGFTWHQSAGTLSVYNDDDNFIYHAPGGDIQITPNLALLPNTYTMGFSKDYKKLITDIMLYGEFVDRRE